MRNPVGKLLVVGLAVSAMLTSGLGGAASAGAPEEIEFSFTFNEIQPCSGDVIEVTLNIVARFHLDHPSNTVGIVKRTGSASDGSILVSGTESGTDNSEGVRTRFNDIWFNPETGERYRTSFQYIDNFNDSNPPIGGSLQVRCLGH